MPRVLQASISSAATEINNLGDREEIKKEKGSAAREINNLGDREEIKKEKASVASENFFKKDVSHFD